jgi:hypothetical protein
MGDLGTALLAVLVAGTVACGARGSGGGGTGGKGAGGTPDAGAGGGGRIDAGMDAGTGGHPPDGGGAADSRPGTGGGGSGGAAGIGGAAGAAAPPPVCASGVVCADVCALSSDIHRCGSCSNDCASLPHVAGASLACRNGACSSTCAPGFDDCAHTGAGCPDVLSSPTQCGACGAACPAGRPLCAPDGSGGFSCVSACPASAPENCNGTCVDTTRDPANCNVCGRACVTFAAHAVPICQNALCDTGCAPGYELCDGACVDFASDPAHCGGCGSSFTCSAPMRCRAAHCICEATCQGQCVDAETDAKNCGACGHDCLGGTCSGGVCQPVTLATGRARPVCLVVDGDTVFWSDQDGGAVMKVATDGTGLSPVAEGQDEPFGLAVDATNVYWTNGGYNVALMKAPRAGGAAVPLTTGTPLRSLYRAIGLDRDNVYFADTGTIKAIPIGGGTPVQLTMASPNGPCHIAIQGTRLYWAAYPGQDAVQSVPLAGGMVQNLFTMPSPIGDTWGIAVNADRIFWTETAAGTLQSMPLAGGTALTVATRARAYGVALDSARVYWSASTSIESLPLAGGASSVVHATGQSAAFDVAVDQKAIYWVDWNRGTVMKVAK